MGNGPMTQPLETNVAVTAESLTIQAYRRLRAGILAGELPPDQKLKVESLRQTLGFGASPIREALSLLTSDGLVERFDNRGFRVANVSLADFDDLQQARCWLEDRALREAVKHGKQDWEEEVMIAQHRLVRTPRSIQAGSEVLTNPAWEELHKLFHMTLISACPSKTLLRICDQLYDRNTRYRSLAMSKSQAPRQWKDEHAAIVEAVIDRDADVAAERLVQHYTRTGQILRASLDLPP